MKKYILLVLLFNLILCATQISEFKIDGMMCGFGCVDKIKKEMDTIEGVQDYSVSFEKSNMIVTYNNKLVNDKVIMDKLNSNTTYSCSLKNQEKNNSFISFFKNLF
tara:strand:+ start:266 stop:583 length:318 start_codon:yes stop_codon:yes gene_type:complete